MGFTNYHKYEIKGFGIKTCKALIEKSLEPTTSTVDKALNGAAALFAMIMFLVYLVLVKQYDEYITNENYKKHMEESQDSVDDIIDI